MSLGVFGVCGWFDLLVLDLVLHGSLWSCQMVGFVDCLWVAVGFVGCLRLIGCFFYGWCFAWLWVA